MNKYANLIIINFAYFFNLKTSMLFFCEIIAEKSRNSHASVGRCPPREMFIGRRECDLKYSYRL